MRNDKIIPVTFAALWFAGILFAIEPNFVKSTIYKVGKDGADAEVDLTTTQYSDGMGRTMQTKTDLNDSDRVVCKFYDNLGRLEKVTRPFIDKEKKGTFLAGGLDDAVIADKLKATYSNDTRAFNTSVYYSDPLERIAKDIGPGVDFESHPVERWYFGVGVDRTTVTVGAGTEDEGTVTFDDGFIVDIDRGTCPTIQRFLTTVYEHFVTWHNPFVNWIDLVDKYRYPLCTVVDETKGQVLVNCIHYALTVTSDPNGHIVQELKDGFGNIVATRSDPDDDIADDEIIARMEYDVLGNIVREIAPKEGPEGIDPKTLIENTEYEYNKLGQLVRKSTADGSVERYLYTATGKLKYTNWYTHDENETMLRSISNEYDRLDRLVTVYESRSDIMPYPINVPVMAYFYDAINDLSSIKGLGIPAGLLASLNNIRGRMAGQVVINKTSAKDYFVTDLFSYDDEGRIKTKYKIVPGIPVQQIDYTYDIQGKKLTEVLHCGTDGVTKEYRYNVQGQLEKIVHVENNKELATYTYDAIGRLHEKKLGIESGYTIPFAYNVRDWITAIGNSVQPYFSQTIAYWNEDETYYNGNIGSVQTRYSDGGANNLSTSLEYYYDGVNRLTSVTKDDVENTGHYSYDAIGRFKNKKEENSNHDDYRYYSSTNRLKHSKTSGRNYVFDEFGNMVINLNKSMVVRHDWRDLPVCFSFYNKLEVGAGKPIRVDERGTYSIDPAVCADCNLDKYLSNAVAANTIQLLSTVTMLYDASGNRVLKIAGNP